MAATKRAIDMTNVEDKGNERPRRLPEGDYRLKIVSVDDHTSKKKEDGSGGNPGWKFVLAPVDFPRATYPYYTDFQDKTAFKIRNLLVAAGINVPKKRVNIDPNKLVGKFVGATLEDDEYDGREKSTIAGVFPVSELSGDSPSNKASGTKSTKSTKTPPEDEDIDEDVDADTGEDDGEDLDLDEL